MKLAKLAVLFVCLALTRSILSQDTSSPPPNSVLRLSSDLVVVDVVVTDAAGKPVHGLKQSNFTVAENKLPQKITSFTEHTATDAASAAPMPKFPPGIFTNYVPAPPGAAVNILLLDQLNTSIVDQSIVRDQLLEYLKHPIPGTQIAIFGLNSRLVMLQPFTADPDVLRRAISGKNSTPSVLPQETGAPNPMDEAGSLTGNSAADADLAYNVASFQKQNQSAQLLNRVQATLDGLNQLARFLADIPGRKNLIWFSGSFPISVLPDPDADNKRFLQFMGQFSMQEGFQETSALLGHSQVAVYPIDARGLMVSPTLSAQNSGSKLTSPGAYSAAERKFSTDTFNDHATMEDLAQGTGGRKFVDTNGLAQAVASAINAGANYYTVAYVPTVTASPGEYRSIRLQLAQTTPKYSLAYRRGYFGDATPDRNAPGGAHTSASQNAFNLAALHGAPPLTQILFKVAIFPASNDTEPSAIPHNSPSARQQGPWKRYLVQFAADSHQLTHLDLPDGKIHVAISLVSIVYDEQGNIINSTSNNIGANLTEAQYEGLRKTGIQYRQQISVPLHGAYTIRTVVNDQLGSHLGAVEIPLTAVQNLPPLNLPPPTDTR